MPDPKSRWALDLPLTPPPDTSALPSRWAEKAQDRLTDAVAQQPTMAPDQAARIFKLQQKTGLPADVIGRNLDLVEKQASTQGFDAEQFRKQTPLLAGWLEQHPLHGPLTRTDLVPLTAIEHTLKFGENAARAVGSGLVKGTNLGFWSILEAGGDVVGNYDLSKWARDQNDWAQKTSQRVKGEQLGAGYYEKVAYSGFESIGTSLPILAVTVLTKNPTLALSLMGTQTGGQAYSDARGAGVPVSQALAYGTAQGMIEAWTESLGTHWLLKDLAEHAGLFKTLAHQVVTEGFTEQVATHLQDLMEWSTLHPDTPFAGYVSARPQAALDTLLAVGVTVVGQGGAAHTLNRVVTGLATRRLTADLNESIKETGLLKTAPDKLQEFLTQATKDTPNEVRYADPTDWVDYWRGNGEDPAARAEQIGISRAAFDDALATGADLEIPLAAFSVQMADHATHWADLLREVPGEMNAEETTQFLADLQAQQPPAGAIQMPPPLTLVEQMQADLTAHLVDQAQMHPLEAHTNAALLSSLFKTIESVGLNPQDILNRRFGGTTLETAPPATPAPPPGGDLAQRAVLTPEEARALLATPDDVRALDRRQTQVDVPLTGLERRASITQTTEQILAGLQHPDAPIDTTNIGAAAAQMVREDPSIRQRAAVMQAKAAGNPYTGTPVFWGYEPGVDGAPLAKFTVQTETGPTQIPATELQRYGMPVPENIPSPPGPGEQVSGDELRRRAIAARNPVSLFQSVPAFGTPTAPMFFSRLIQAVDASKMTKGTIAEWINQIETAKTGADKLELAAVNLAGLAPTAVTDFLDEQIAPTGDPLLFDLQDTSQPTDGRYTKQQILDFLALNQLQMVPVVNTEAAGTIARGYRSYVVHGPATNYEEHWITFPTFPAEGEIKTPAGQPAGRTPPMIAVGHDAQRGIAFSRIPWNPNADITIRNTSAGGPGDTEWAATHPNEQHGPGGGGYFVYVDGQRWVEPLLNGDDEEVPIHVWNPQGRDAALADAQALYAEAGQVREPLPEPPPPPPPTDETALQEAVDARVAEMAEDFVTNDDIDEVVNTAVDNRIDENDAPQVRTGSEQIEVEDPDDPDAAITMFIATHDGERIEDSPEFDTRREAERYADEEAQTRNDELRDEWESDIRTEEGNTRRRRQIRAELVENELENIDRDEVEETVRGEWEEERDAQEAVAPVPQGRPSWVDGHSEYNKIRNPAVRLRVDTRTSSAGLTLFINEIQPPKEEQTKRVPDILQRNWRPLALKYALALATERGMDAVAWATGEQSAALYSLEKAVDSMEWGIVENAAQGPVYVVDPAGAGEGGQFAVRRLATADDHAKTIAYYNTQAEADAHAAALTEHLAPAGTLWYLNIKTKEHGEIRLIIDPAPADGRDQHLVVSSTTHLIKKGEKLNSTIQNEYIKKMRTAPTGELTGDELKFGGAGLKRVYDEDLPNNANKIAAMKAAKAKTVTPPKVGEVRPADAPALVTIDARVENSDDQRWENHGGVVDVVELHTTFDPTNPALPYGARNWMGHWTLQMADGSVWGSYPNIERARPEQRRWNERMAKQLADAGKLQSPQPAIVLTPELKAALGKGVPLFQSVPDTPAFKAWWGDSQVVDDAGQPLVVYHGANRLDRFGPTMKKGRATSGPMPFFTTDTAIASKYADGKIDNSLPEGDLMYEAWFRLKVGTSKAVNLDRAWHLLTPEQRAAVAAFAPRVTMDPEGSGRIELGPPGLTTGTGGYDQHLTEARGNHFKALIEEWLNSGNLFDNEKEFRRVLELAGAPVDDLEYHDPHADRSGVAPVFLSIQKPLVTNQIPPDVVAAIEKASRRQRPRGQSAADIWDKSQRDPATWVSELKNDLDTGKNSYVWSSIPDWVTRVLKGLGYDGIHDTGGKGGGAAHDVWIPFEPGQVKSALGNRGTFDRASANILNQPQRRASITFDPTTGKAQIALYALKDRSSFIHEFGGHLHLEMLGDVVDRLGQLDRATLTDAQRRLVDEYHAVLLPWLGPDTRPAGGENGMRFSPEQHEKFADGVEDYLMTNRAPSIELQPIFARVKAWMLDVYRQVKRTVLLTPEVRSFMDRLLASDDAIAAVEAQGAIAPIFTTAEEAGKTPEEWALYRKTVEAASIQAREKLAKKALLDLRREQSALYDSQRQTIHDEVERALEAQPVYRALAAIRKGTHPNGETLIVGQDVKPLKLDRAKVVEAIGEAAAKALPKPYLYSADGGIDPGIVAEMFGFTNAADLLDTIGRTPKFEAVLELQTERRMVEEHGGLLVDGTLPSEAQDAVANDGREQVIRAEIRALQKLSRTVGPHVRLAERPLRAQVRALTGQVEGMQRTAQRGPGTIARAIPSAVAINEAAQTRLARTPIRDLHPQNYWHAAQKANRDAIAAAARQDFDAAITAHTQQLIALASYRATQKAMADISQRLNSVKALDTVASRKRMGLAGQTYQDQIDGFLDRYEFAKVSDVALKRRAGLREWAASMAGLGYPVQLTDAQLDDAKRVNYRDLPYADLVTVTDAIDQVVHLAQLKNRLLDQHDKRTFSEQRDGVVDSIVTNNLQHPQPLEPGRPDQQAKRTVADWIASHRKLAFIVNALDGYVDGGPFWEAFIRPINAAADAEVERKTVEGRAYWAIVNQHYPGRELARLNDRVPVAGLKESLSKEGRLAVALNYGNPNGRERLLNDPARKWTQAQVAAILDTLDARDWRFVQDTWAFNERFWPEIEALEKRVTGLAPAKVAYLPFQTKTGGLVPGGYYHIGYDARLSPGADQHETASLLKFGAQASYVRSTTRQGFVEEQKASTGLSLKLELGVEFSHIEEVIHSITHREMVSDVSRLLRDRRLRDAIVATKGDLVYKQLTLGVQDIALGTLPAAKTIMEKAASFAKSGTQISQLAFNVWTALQQPFGWFNGAAEIGPGYVAKGMVRWLRSANDMEGTVAWVAENSTFMRNRWQTSTQEFTDLRAVLRKPGGWFDTLLRTVSGDALTQQTILDSYLWHISMMQRVADMPVWLGALEKFSEQHPGDEKRAIALADQAILNSQGGGQIKDLAQVQRGGPIARLYMAFYSYGNMTINQAGKAVGKTNPKSPAQVARMLGNLSLIYVAPAMMTVMLAHLFGRGKDDDDWSDYLRQVGGESLATAMNGIVVLREFAGLLGEGTRGYAGPAGARLAEILYSFGQQAKQLEPDEAFFKALNQVGGTFLGYPAAQAQKTVDGYLALQSGRSHNPLVLLTGPPPKAK